MYIYSIQDPRDGKRVYSSLCNLNGVICVWLNAETGVVKTRGSASVQDIYLVLKGLGYQSQTIREETEKRNINSESAPANPDTESAQKHNYVDKYGYIADTRFVLSSTIFNINLINTM